VLPKESLKEAQTGKQHYSPQKEQRMKLASSYLLTRMPAFDQTPLPKAF